MRIANWLACPIILMIVSPVVAQSISATDAKSHVGEKATVCGKVASERTATGSKGEPTFINLDVAYPNQVFTILIWGEDRPKVGTLPSEGSRVCATGTIQDYRGVPEVVVRNREQLNPGSQFEEAPAQTINGIVTACSTCSHLNEPDWRPTHFYISSLHVNKVVGDSVNVTVGISRYVASGLVYKNEVIDNSECSSHCSQWKWVDDKDYSVQVSESPAYIPACVKTATGWIENCRRTQLPAVRNISIDFGKSSIVFDLSVSKGDPLNAVVK